MIFRVKYTKTIHLTSYILIISLMISTVMSPVSHVSAASDSYILELPDGTNVTAQFSSSLLWNTNSNNVSLNCRLTDLGSNSSYVIFELITYKLILPNNDTISYPSALTSYPYINESSTDFFHELEIDTPDTVDEFTIEITVRLTNSSFYSELVSDYFVSFTFIFPQEGVIKINRDRLFPLIDLYGFPEREAFLKWFLIYFSTLVFISSPSILFGGIKLSRAIKRRRKR